MQSYLLTTSNRELFNVLKELDSHPMDINGICGFIITKENNNELVEFLTKFLKPKLSKENSKLELRFLKTGYEGIIEASLSVVSPYKVIVDSWNGENQEEFARITKEILGGVIDKRLIIYVPHGESCKPRKKDFNIFIWSSPTGIKSSIEPPKRIYDINVDCRDGIVPTSHEGIPLYSDNYIVAELVNGNNLYIHHDACHYGTENELHIYRKILLEVVHEMSLTNEDHEKQLLERAEQNKDMYVNLCMNRMRLEQSKRTDKICDLKSTIKKLRDDLITNYRTLEKEELLINNFDAALAESKERYISEFDKLLKLDKVIGIDVTDHGIEIFTDTLYCKNPKTNRIHEIGKFVITIPIGSGDITWNNITRRVKGFKENMHAPHIFSNGRACLGNAEQVLPKLIATYQFSIIASYAIQFVESVNINDSAGSYLGKWPTAKEV